MLQEKYKPKCPKESFTTSTLRNGELIDLEYTCWDIEKILMVWKYNGIIENKETGEYDSDYLALVANELDTLDDHFSGIVYHNTDYLIDKLQEVDRYKETIFLYSPGDLYIVDSEDRITGIVDGEEKDNIPNSAYDAINKSVVILFPQDSFRYNVVGTDEGTYGLSIDSTNDGVLTIFNAVGIPISTGVVHQYTVDWDELAQGGNGVILQIDSDADGIFEKTIVADDELIYNELLLQTETIIDFDPNTLNLQSKGKPVTVYIELPEGFDVNQITTSSVMLNDLVPILSEPTEVGDYDHDGVLDLMVKFERSQVQAILSIGEEVPVTITGQVFYNDNYLGFRGYDMIKVISKGDKENSKK